MTPELEQLQKEARDTWSESPCRGILQHECELLDELIAKAFLAGEKSGRNKAVDYIEDQIESYMDLETKKYGADTTIEEYNKLLMEARTS